MKEKVLRKREGFSGQRIIVIPKKIISDFIGKDIVAKQLYVTDIGYYPKARFHYINRPAGISQHIIIYCVEGSGCIEIDKKAIDIQPSRFIGIPANTPHKYFSNEKDPWTIYWIHFKGDLSASLMELLLQTAKNNQQDITYNEKRVSLFEEIYSNLEKGYSIDNLRYLNMVFHYFLSSLLYPSRFDHIEARSEKEDIIDLVIARMQKNIDSILTLPELADFANLSVSHFSALFKNKTGYSPIEYFNHLKVQKASQYLLTSKMAVKEIAVNLGVNDPYYFSRMFSKLMGISPDDYRKRNKSEK